MHIERYKDILVDEANRLYDRLLKHLTDSIMDNVDAASMPNPTSSLPQSSSPLPNLSNQSDIYRIEESTFHNNKGDNADWFNDTAVLVSYAISIT